MRFLHSFLLIFVTVFLKQSSCACVDKFALSYVDALVHKQKNSKAIVVKEENFNLLDGYLFIDVTRANVSQLCEGMIKNFPRLESLALINLNLTNIEPGTFQNVPKLKNLVLSVNQLTTIQRHVFNNIPRLKSIYLTRNQIESIDDGAFAEMLELKAVYLNHNKITQLTGNLFFGSPKISLVDFSYNMIKRVSKTSFEDLRPDQSVKELSIFLKNNEIAEIEQDTLKELIPVNLYLEGNQITRISEAVFSAKEGSSLNFSKNKVTCVADDVLEWIKTRNIVVSAKNNPVDCGCFERIEAALGGEIRGELNIDTTLPCNVNFPFFSNDA